MVPLPFPQFPHHLLGTLGALSKVKFAMTLEKLKLHGSSVAQALSTEKLTFVGKFVYVILLFLKMDFQSTSLSNTPSPNLIFPKTLSGLSSWMSARLAVHAPHPTPPHSPQKSVPAQCRSCSTNGHVALEEEPGEYTVSEALGWA